MDIKSEVCDDSKTDLIGHMGITDIVEHDDGTATVTFDMSPEILHALLSYGLKMAILNGINSNDTN